MKARTFIAGLAVGAALSGAAGIAYATIPDSNGTIHACYGNNNGLLRVIDSPSQSCRNDETPLSWSQGGGQGPQNVTVDCTTGGSINQVLQQNQNSEAPLTINIKGTCVESVNVHRDNVTLQAVSPGDGIQAPSPNDPALVLDGSRNVFLGQLTLTTKGLGAVLSGVCGDGQRWLPLSKVAAHPIV